MRRVRYQVAASLDGYIAEPDGGEPDWIPRDPEVDFATLFDQFDTFLMGRRTFESVSEAGGGVSDAFAGKKVVVVSRTLKEADHPGVQVVSDHLEEAVAALRKERGKDIWLFGGGLLFRSLLDLGLVDTVEVAVIPVLLGGGIPLLPARASRARLRLTGHRLYANTGTVLLEYDVEEHSHARTSRRPRKARRVTPRGARERRRRQAGGGFGGVLA
ncbi:MAG TPA: dihydrofolate reductase family protein [Anaeromyxobacteraceae bacterium]|nr:dihydrofolate reductase family protein [Anaeromyxobacteraceae bacterium]